jgi:hypothetical protein
LNVVRRWELVVDVVREFIRGKGVGDIFRGIGLG